MFFFGLLLLYWVVFVDYYVVDVLVFVDFDDWFWLVWIFGFEEWFVFVVLDLF